MAMSPEQEREMAAVLLANLVTDSLQDMGYSKKALQLVFQLLVDALLNEDEYSVSELLLEIQRIHGNEDNEIAELEAEPVIYLN